MILDTSGVATLGLFLVIRSALISSGVFSIICSTLSVRSELSLSFGGFCTTGVGVTSRGVSSILTAIGCVLIVSGLKFVISSGTFFSLTTLGFSGVSMTEFRLGVVASVCLPSKNSAFIGTGFMIFSTFFSILLGLICEFSLP